ncbi:HAD family hydrolase [Paeniglutamicibacter kerguelensis]|uniref:Phosphoserine phosphatase n=1 Tax=Paeniglutamicibacter kerguelensis TaxID=254788 RepID=A0ABS4XIC1_9MICC|nr:HAD family hydrolase [Paeniglutamicibacter kerguelensis]MBP2388202.1 phosphoserine phosphatase [Paeniglutamicibacter kerguelensis]
MSLLYSGASPDSAGLAGPLSPSTELPVARALFCSDLDRTLIYSAAALMLDGADHDAPSLQVAEILEGRPQSYLTNAASGLLTQIAEAGAFVPVTTRTVAQYRRIRFHGPRPKYAVTTNGAQILVDGVPDQEWSDSLGHRVANESAPLEEISAYVLLPIHSEWMLRLRDAEGLFLYAMVERENLPAETLTYLTAWCASRNWTVSLQGRKLYFIPSLIGKEFAVAEVARRMGGPRVVAAGDSLLDKNFLGTAFAAIRPSHGELEESGFEAKGLTVTKKRGVLAGEEIVRAAHGMVFGDS